MELNKVKYFAVILIFFYSCSTRTEFGNKKLSSKFKKVNWTELKQNLSQYHNDTILISGKYIHLFENSTINNGLDGIWIDAFESELEVNIKEQDNFTNKNILVLGKFDSIYRGHLDQYLGSINEFYYLKIE